MMASVLGAHLPWAQVETCLAPILDLGLAPEIAIKGPELDTIDERLVLTSPAGRRSPTQNSCTFF